MNHDLMTWLAKEAAARNTTSRSQSLSVSSAEGRAAASTALKAEPPNSAQGHSPTRYGRKVK